MSNPSPDRGEVVVYEVPEGGVRVDVRLEGETVWLTQQQMAELFGRERSVVTKHILNVFEEGELDPKATSAKFAQVRKEGKRAVLREVDHFNLDVILSVGYRVSSKRGTQFRIWATRTLREHLLRGYTLNERRLREKGLGEMEQAVGLLAKTLTQHALVTGEGRAVLDVVQGYTRAWRWLLEYDEERLAETPTRPKAPIARLTLDSARAVIASLRKDLAKRGEATALFGKERGEQLGTILASIEQTFGKKPLYPTAQVRAAHVFYFVIKDHPFSDGNKRVGTLLFLEYLRLNGLLVRADKSPRLADNAMVALALLVAESEPKQKELMIRLVLNLLEDGPA
ncbi:MAG: virulence protein RhuM/Fic/DOC family protein [Planctomycetota bacterium]